MGPSNRVRETRLVRGLSQVSLAERVGVSRQSLGAIEAGRAVPSVHIALELAEALDCDVADLFGDGRQDSLEAEPTEPLVSGRVAVARLGERWVCFPLKGDCVHIAADGIAAAASPRRSTVELLRPIADIRDNIVLTGCAPALGLLADRLNSRPGPGRFMALPGSSTAALKALARTQTHLAGVHLVDETSGEANVPDVRRAVRGLPLVLVTLARWEVGLLTRPEDVKRIRDISALARSSVRLVTREPGAGARRLLERELAAAGVPTARACAPLSAAGHLDVARAITLGAADAGIATRDAATAFGLRFLPLAVERYDLALPSAALGDLRIQRLFDTVASAMFRRELACLGYDTSSAGDRVAEIGAA